MKIKIPNFADFGLEYHYAKKGGHNEVFSVSFPDDKKQEFQDWCSKNDIETAKIISNKNKCIFSTDEISMFDFDLENNIKKVSASVKFVSIILDEDEEYYATIRYEYLYNGDLRLGKCEFGSKSQFDLILQIFVFFKEESLRANTHNISFEDLTLRRTPKISSSSHPNYDQIDFYFQFWYKNLLVSEDTYYQKALDLARKITKKI